MIDLTIAACVLAYVTGFILSLIALTVNINEDEKMQGGLAKDMNTSPGVEMRRSNLV